MNIVLDKKVTDRSKIILVLILLDKIQDGEALTNPALVNDSLFQQQYARKEWKLFLI